jgi:hypothetical protein
MPKAPTKTNLGPFIGIDPGKSGGIAALCRSDVWVWPMPTTERDIWDRLRCWEEGTTAVIEKVGGYTGEGQPGSRMFNFGKNYGSLLMALTAAEIKFEEVTPQQWQKTFAVVPRKYKTVIDKKASGSTSGKKKVWLETKGQFKDRLRRKAQQIFPQLPIWREPRSKGRQLEICDSLLIAEFCRRKHTGTL